MHQYWYVNSKGNRQLYTNQISVPQLYSQPQIPKFGGINGLGIPEGWSGRVYPAGWKISGGFHRMEQPVIRTSSAGQLGLTAQEPSSSWTTPADNTGSTSQKQLGNSLPPVDHDDWESEAQHANWPQLPEQLGFMTQAPWAQPINHAGMFPQGKPLGWASSTGNKGFNPQKQPFPWVQPINHAGMFPQGPHLGWAPSAGNKGFNPQKQPFPWGQQVNNKGMFPQGHPAAFLPPAANPFGFGANGQQANWGGFGTPAGWGGQVHPMGWGGPGAPMGWGYNGGNGQLGILGGLLKLGKGTMGGLGIISNLIGVGKILF